MKRVILFVLLLQAFIASAQVCTPEWSGGGSGINPDTTTNFPQAVINQPYDEVVQFRVPLEDTSLGFPIELAYVELLSITGLTDIPASVPFNYSCNPSNCQFVADSTGCVRLQGTPTTVGTYPLLINVKVHTTTNFVIPLTYSGYKIVVTQGIGIPPVNMNVFDVSQNLPNPVKTKTDIVVNTPHGGTLSFKVSDLLGNSVYNNTISARAGVNTITFDATALPPGVYFYTITNGSQVMTRRMVVDKKGN